MNSVSITFCGQSCFLFESQSTSILIDPGKKSHGQVKADIVYAIHRHFDHTRGIEEFLKFNDDKALLISNEQVIENYSEWGDQVKTIEDGEIYETSSFKLEFITCRHD